MKTCPVCDTDYPDQHTNCDTDGAVLIVSQELAPGTIIRGKYRIIRKIGQGGMGVVYLAEDSLLGVKVALKFLAGDLGKDPRFIKRFRTEARAAYQLRHPNIAEVTNLDQAEDGSLFIAMEYIEGPSLRAILDQSPNGLAIPRALEIAKGITSGLAAAHAQGTIHRDIKPENILITRAADGTERAKILDFGIAAVAESVTRMTRTQGFILTYAYAAPEQWQEMPAEQMDGRTDLYALGCVLYEMLTGSTPFHAHTTAGWMTQHLEESPKPPSTLRPELADWSNLDALLAALLSKNRNNRPSDAAKLITLLAAVKHLPRPKEVKTVVEQQKPFVVDRRETVRIKQREVLVQKEVMVEEVKPGPKPIEWIKDFLQSRWRLITAISVAPVLLLFAVPRFVLPQLFVYACEQNKPELAQWLSMTYYNLGRFGTDLIYLPGFSFRGGQGLGKLCASGEGGENCLRVAGRSFRNGDQVFDQRLQEALITRGMDLMTKDCYKADNPESGLECQHLGDADVGDYSRNYPERSFFESKGPTWHLPIPIDVQKAVAAYSRGCDLSSVIDACKSAGDLYFEGSGIVKDLTKARLFYAKAYAADCRENEVSIFHEKQREIDCSVMKERLAEIDTSEPAKSAKSSK